MRPLKARSNIVNDARDLDELDLKEIVQKRIDTFKDHAENKVFDSLKDETYFRNLKRDILEAKGIENPVICFPDGTLIEGHSRITVLRELIEEGKIPKDYKVPTLIYKGSQADGKKRLILGNLNRFEIPFPTKIKLWKELGYFGGDDTVSPPFTNKELSEILNLSERQVQRVKAILREVEDSTKQGDDTVSPPPLLSEKEELKKIQDAIDKQNKKRKDKEPKPPKKPQNQNRAIQKSDPIKPLPKGSKRLEIDLSADEVKVLAQYLSLSDYYETLKQILKSGDKAETLREVFEKITKALNK